MTSNRDLRRELVQRYAQVRALTMRLSEPLSAEDHVVQSAWFVSPAKWHLAHTTWFFESFILKDFWPEHQTFAPAWDYLFNSYYNSMGEQFEQARRGLLARPTVDEIKQYRHAVDQAMMACMVQCRQEVFERVRALVILGLHHEQQHQELFLTDIKHVFATNPLHPVYTPRPEESLDRSEVQPLQWLPLPSGVVEIGVNAEDVEFSYDNESPAHEVMLHGGEIADRLITNAEYIEFIDDHGYERVELWLADGFGEVEAQGWKAPMYWKKIDGIWHVMGLHGLEIIALDEPVCHLSFYEADAYARWVGARLPTEAEWEVAAKTYATPSNEGSDEGSDVVESVAVRGHFVDSGILHPALVYDWFGSVWQWTSSPYIGYPGYRAPEGALGEYNGKFMCNTIVLRGGSCASSQSHLRASYRNFFSPPTRWQFTGIRLARD